MAREDERREPGRTEPGRAPGARTATPARRNEGARGLRRYEPWGPSSFWGAGPFSLMRRMTEDLDRLFGEFGGGRDPF